MAKELVPSELVTFIDQKFPKAKEFLGKSDQFELKFHYGHSGALSALVLLVEGMDDALLSAKPEDLSDLRLATEFIKHQVKRWEIGTKGEISFIEGSGRQNPVVMLRRILDPSGSAVVEIRSCARQSDPLEYIRIKSKISSAHFGKCSARSSNFWFR